MDCNKNDNKFGIEADFELIDKSVNFFNNNFNKNDNKDIKSKHFNNIDCKSLIDSILKLKDETSNYLQVIMESNDKLGAKIKEADEAEEEEN